MSVIQMGEVDDELDVLNNWEDYLPLIKRVRKKASDGPKFLIHDNDGKMVSSFYLLPRQNDPPEAFIDIKLTAHKFNIVVRLRKDNLYVVGHLAQNGTWFELDYEKGKCLIEGSKNLKLGYRYGALETEASKNRNEIQLGQHQFVNAISHLAKTTEAENFGKQRPETAKNLIILIESLSEALRFKAIANFVARSHGKVPAMLLLYLENEWENNSKKFQKPGYEVPSVIDKTMEDDEILSLQALPSDYVVASYTSVLLISPSPASKPE